MLHFFVGWPQSNWRDGYWNWRQTHWYVHGHKDKKYYKYSTWECVTSFDLSAKFLWLYNKGSSILINNSTIALVWWCIIIFKCTCICNNLLDLGILVNWPISFGNLEILTDISLRYFPLPPGHAIGKFEKLMEKCAKNEKRYLKVHSMYLYDTFVLNGKHLDFICRQHILNRLIHLHSFLGK